MRVFQQLVPGWAEEGLSCRGRIEQAQCTSKINITEYKRQCIHQPTALDGPTFFLATRLHLFTPMLREMYSVS